MPRRFVVLLEVLALCGIVAWVGVAIGGGAEHAPGAIDLKVQLAGAQDRVWLEQAADGTFAYRIHRDDGTQELLAPEQFARMVYADRSGRGFWSVLLNVSSPAGYAWVLLGLLGQVLFTGRMVVQWLASERHRRSVVPVGFWWMSLIGASMLLAYFVWRKEPIGVLGQATGWFVYVRNLWLIYRPAPATPAAAAASGQLPAR